MLVVLFIIFSQSQYLAIKIKILSLSECGVSV